MFWLWVLCCVCHVSAGQFYVMMSPQDVLQANNQRSIAPRTGLTPRIEGARSSRDDRRRATHNEGNRPVSGSSGVLQLPFLKPSFHSNFQEKSLTLTALTSVCVFLCLCGSVERRRRDKINNWIVQLSKLIPDCAVEHSKSGQVQEVCFEGLL